MKPRTVIALFTLVLSAIMAFAPAAQGKDDFQQDFRVKEGQTIELDMDNGGSLEVEGWDKNLVQINCDARLNDIEDWNIKITETRKGLKFVAKLKDRSIHSSDFTVRLMVPETFNIKTESGGGHISIEGVSGEFSGKSAGGSITLHNVSGEAHLKTGGGDIEIEIENGYVKAVTGAGDIEITVIEGLGDGREGIDVTTGYGETLLTLPKDASVEFDLDLSYTRNSSRDFEINCDFDLDIEETDKWESRHGSPRKHIYGTGSINGGKHRVIIKVVNGDIIIRKR